METGKADLLSALESSLCSTYPTEAPGNTVSQLSLGDPAALSSPFDPVCPSFSSPTFRSSEPFPYFSHSSPQVLPPTSRLQDGQGGCCNVGFPSHWLARFPSPFWLAQGSWPLCVFTNHSFLSASLPQAACYCSCAVFLTAFPHKFNTTTPLVQNKRGELAGACKKEGRGLISSGPFFATAGVHANLWGDGNSNIMRY